MRVPVMRTGKEARDALSSYSQRSIDVFLHMPCLGRKQFMRALWCDEAARLTNLPDDEFAAWLEAAKLGDGQ